MYPKELKTSEFYHLQRQLNGPEIGILLI